MNTPYFPAAINDQGQIVGYFTSYGGQTSSILDTGGSITPIVVPAATSTRAVAINNLGQITGLFSDSSGEQGFLDTAGAFSTIAVPGATSTSPAAINDDGIIVGTCYLAGIERAFLYQNGTYTTIDVPGANITGFIGNSVEIFTLSGINDAGEIVGVYYSPGLHDFFAVPTPVPEPSTFSLTGMVLALLTCMNVKRDTSARSRGRSVSLPSARRYGHLAL